MHQELTTAIAAVVYAAEWEKTVEGHVYSAQMVVSPVWSSDI